jgi:hypothetical protein
MDFLCWHHDELIADLPGESRIVDKRSSRTKWFFLMGPTHTAYAAEVKRLGDLLATEFSPARQATILLSLEFFKRMLVKIGREDFPINTRQAAVDAGVSVAAAICGEVSRDLYYSKQTRESSFVMGFLKPPE